MSLRHYFKKGYDLVQRRLNAKSNYKIFLNKTFEGVEQGTLKCKILSDLISMEIKPLVIEAPFADSMLVVAPHQDDESIGCGGAICAQLEQKKRVYLAFIMDGGNEYKELEYPTRESLAEKRESEALNMCHYAGIETPTFLRSRNMNQERDRIIGALADLIEKTKAKSIFTPFFLDSHAEHEMTTFCLAQALKKIPHAVTVYCYEVWSHCIPNVILNIDKYVEKKKKMIAFHESQLMYLDYVNTTIGFNMYHSRVLGKNSKHAERFFEVPKKEFIEIADKLKGERC